MLSCISYPPVARSGRPNSYETSDNDWTDGYCWKSITSSQVSMTISGGSVVIIGHVESLLRWIVGLGCGVDGYCCC